MSPRRVRTTPSHPPLKRVASGVWRSHDGAWTFLRHASDPKPQRWFAYSGECERPSNEGHGHVRLADAANWALGDG